MTSRRRIQLGVLALALVVSGAFVGPEVSGASPMEGADVVAHSMAIRGHRTAAPRLMSVRQLATGSTDFQAPYTAQALASMYGLPVTATGVASTTTTATIGIVEGGYDSSTEDRLWTYRSHMGLPPCTRANGCFSEYVAANGSTPDASIDIQTETDLDVDMVSAICPSCHIMVAAAPAPGGTTANGGSMTSAGEVNAVQWLLDNGAQYISISYSGGEDPARGSIFATPGAIFVASSGDDGYKADWPASLPSVVAAGGTTPIQRNGVWSATAWENAGSWCARYSTEVPQQPQTQDAATACPNSERATSDVSAIADPEDGVSVYSVDDNGTVGWWELGGTSAAAPIVAALYAVAGNNTDPGVVYRNAQTYPQLILDPQAVTHHDSRGNVTGTSRMTNGCPNYVICTVGVGWDGPTGIGTPTTPELFSIVPTVPRPVVLTIQDPRISAVAGDSLDAAPVTAVGGNGTLTWTATGLPPGVSINSASGGLTGSASSTGSYAVTITATDSTGKQSSATIVLAIVGPVTLLPTLGQSLVASFGDAVSATPFGVTGGVAPYTWSAIDLPGGLTVDPATGTITGSPTAKGKATFTVQVSDTRGHTQVAAITLDVEGVSGPTPHNPRVRVGKPVRWDTSVSTPAAKWYYTATGLPAGLTINHATGIITGRPKRAGHGKITSYARAVPSGNFISSTRLYTTTFSYEVTR